MIIKNAWLKVFNNGMDSYILDNKSPFCPYLHLHTGDSCAKFVKMNESEVNANDRV